MTDPGFDLPAGITWSMVDQYVAGNADSPDALRVAAWLRDAPEFAAIVAGLRRAGEVPATLERAVLAHVFAGETISTVTPAVSTVATTVSASKTRRRTSKGMSRTSPQRWMWALTAAVCVVLAVVVLRGRVASVPTMTRTYATRTGEQATITLTDGTSVTLAPQSTMRLVQFGAHSRTIELDGQAYFSVTHRDGIPFVVRSGGVLTRVLGTAFMIRHYVTDSHVRVAVAEGKVAVAAISPLRSEVIMTAGHVGDVTDSTVKVTSINDIAPETGWLHGKLVFRDVPIPDVLTALTRWYGYQFRLADSTLAHQNVTIGLSTSSSSEALSVLKNILDVSLTISGDTVTLNPAHPRSRSHERRNNSYDVWTPTREVGR